MSVHLQWREGHGEQETEVDVLVRGPETRADLYAALAANLPATYGTYVLKSIPRAELIPGHDDLWQCSVTYGAFREKRQLQAGENEFRFSSVRRTYTRTVSLASRVFVKEPWPAPPGYRTVELTGDDLPDDARIIGYKESENRATGAQLTEYVNAFSWRVAVPFSIATESWRRDIGRLRGTLCATPFFGYEARSVKFEDLTGGVRGDELYIFELNFEQIDHVPEINIGGIEVTDLEGWDVIDVDEQRLTLDPVRHRLIPTVREVKLHRVHPVADWSAIFALLAMT